MPLPWLWLWRPIYQNFTKLTNHIQGLSRTTFFFEDFQGLLQLSNSRTIQKPIETRYYSTANRWWICLCRFFDPWLWRPWLSERVQLLPRMANNWWLMLLSVYCGYWCQCSCYVIVLLLMWLNVASLPRLVWWYRISFNLPALARVKR